MLARIAVRRAAAAAAVGARVAARKLHVSAAPAAFAIRKPAPAWSCDALMPDGGFATLSSKDFEGSWTLLVWYPLGESRLRCLQCSFGAGAVVLV